VPPSLIKTIIAVISTALANKTKGGDSAGGMFAVLLRCRFFSS
jgi:hypothetical protein